MIIQIHWVAVRWKKCTGENNESKIVTIVLFGDFFSEHTTYNRTQALKKK